MQSRRFITKKKHDWKQRSRMQNVVLGVFLRAPSLLVVLFVCMYLDFGLIHKKPFDIVICTQTISTYKSKLVLYSI